MKTLKKALCMVLVLVMVLGLLPATAAAAEGDYIYLSISFDGKYINDKTGSPIVYVPISMADIEAVDLREYGLENMLYDADGDGQYETTALQLLIYAHEELYGGDWGNVNFDALPGSSYFKGGIFGFTENLVYFLNGDFPVDSNQTSDFMTTGATSDHIVLKAGDFLDVASFNCYSFLWDQDGGFHLFADPEGNYVHDYSAQAGEPLTVKLKHSFCDLMFGESWVKDATDYTVYYGSTFGTSEGEVTTDGDGNAQITFPSAGTYYVWCEGGITQDPSTHVQCETESCIVSAPAYAKVTVTGTAAPETPAPSQSQDVSAVLNATMANLASTVTQPSFGTNYGEWTVLDLARGNYYSKNSQYFADYYNRIVETVNNTAGSVNLNGALDTNKSTDNSRLIVALSALGKDARSVGLWNLVEAYSANGINWIRKQGMNGTIWTLIALDSGNYETSDPTIRQQCVDAIVSAQHNDGGWSLVTAKTQPSNVDITGMTLVALYPYRDQPAVAAACETALTWLSESQLENGGFPYGKGETSESCTWAIVAATTWGINPDTDPRFIKNGNSAIDNLLTYYLEEEAMFEHGRGAGANAMATDQACYALIAYDRFINGKPALFDYSDVTFEEVTPMTNKMTAILSVPKEVDSDAGTPFNASIAISQWDNNAGYKLIDFILSVPSKLTVTDITVNTALTGGSISYNLEKQEDGTGKLRVVYFDSTNNADLNVNSKTYPAQLFNIGFQVAETLTADDALNYNIEGMSVKLSSDSLDENAMVIVETNISDSSIGGSGGGTTGGGSSGVVTGVSYSAVCLYTGDDVDLIPSTKKAVAVAVTSIAQGSKLTYTANNQQIDFLYSPEISAKTGISTYVALVDASIEMESFAAKANYKYNTSAKAETIQFADANKDNVVNAQDALAAVNAWLRKGDALTDNGILTLNVNSDSRINTFDALGIVEAFVNNAEYNVVTKAATTRN